MPLDSAPLVALPAACRQKLEALRQDRYSWWTHWADLAQYILPRRYKWITTPNKSDRGTEINQRIVDSTAGLALRTLASGMSAGITNPSVPWFVLTLENADLAAWGPVKLWLDEVQRRMLRVFAESNFYTSFATLYGDLGCFGTGAMSIHEDYDDVIRCYNSALGEYFLANSDRMAVNTYYREFVMTAPQIVGRWGVANVSASVRAAYQTPGNTVREFVIGHAVEPNDRGTASGAPAGHFPIREVFWEKNGDNATTLEIKGYYEFPVIAPRWDIVANDAYGRSPGMDALGDIKQLQLMTKRQAQAIDKIVNPPLVAPPSMMNAPASTLPGGITYAVAADGKPGMMPMYEVPPNILAITNNIEKVSQRIKETFFYDLFLMFSQFDPKSGITATEIAARKEEKLLMLGPVLTRFFNEALDPAVERTFNIMWRGRLIPPPPPEVRGQKVKIEYVSMLAQAQRAVQTTGMERFAAMVGSLAAGNPEAIDKLDTDEYLDEYGEALGVSPKFIRNQAQVAQIRQGRAQQQQAAAALQASMAAVAGAKTLSETDVGGGQNALSAMTGGQPAAAAA